VVVRFLGFRWPDGTLRAEPWPELIEDVCEAFEVVLGEAKHEAEYLPTVKGMDKQRER